MRALAAAFCLALAVTTPATAGHANSDPIVQAVENHRDDLGEIDRRGDAFVHRATGYVFPLELGDLPARKTVTFGPGDAGVYYTRDGGGNGDAWLTLFVYPADLSLSDEIASIEGALTEAMPGRAVSRPAAAPAPPAGASERWYEATADGQTVVTGYRLVRAGNSYIKARLTVPGAGGPQSLDRGWRALGAVAWTLPPRGAVLR